MVVVKIMSEEEVAIVKVSDDVSLAVSKALKLIHGIKMKGRERIVIKPNLCHASPPETGRTTDIRIVEALIDYFFHRTASSVTIVESDSFGKSASRAFKKLGYTKLANTPNVKVADLSSENTRTKSFDGKFFKKLEVPESLLDYDYFVTAAKLKTSVVERASGAFKNQIGCLPQKEKRCFHPFLNEVLFDLNTLFRPSLCIIDGIVGMEGCGPVDGLPKTMNIIIVGRNAVAVDSVACNVMGIDPFTVPHLKYAYDNGYGEIRIENIKLLGEPLEKVKADFVFIPTKAYNRVRRGMRMGRHPPPIRNLGILLFVWGNYEAGKAFSTRKQRHLEEATKVSAWSFLKKALWTRTWNV